jgi:Helicase associated domain
MTGLGITPVPFWCCSSFTFRLPPPLAPSRLTAARPNPNRLLFSVQSLLPDNSGTKPYYATAKEDEIEDRRLSLGTESDAKEWNATATAHDNNDLYGLVNHSSRDSRQAQQWNAMFEKLQEYKAVHGDCLVPSRYKCDDRTPLGSWVKGQRSVRYTSEGGKRHDEWRRQKLDSIGFVWIVNERGRQLSPETGQYASAKERFNARWNAMFEKLKEYKKCHGHCAVPQRYECADGTKLGVWVSIQRTAGTSDSEMNRMRRQALDAIGFVWQVREPTYTKEKQWNDMFQLLQEYQAAHGDCLVPNDYVTKDKKPLGRWVQTQRSEFASGKLFKDLYKDRLQKLYSIGFVPRALPDDSDDSRWTRLFDQLMEYQRQHGDCLVPSKYPKDRELGNFVKGLRAEADTLSRDRREQLDAIGFAWDQHEVNWLARFHELQKFQRQHGHCLVSRSQRDHDAEYTGLGEWVRTQRRYRHTLDTKRTQQLDSIGFVWGLHETVWNGKLHELQRFQHQPGHWLVSRNQHDAEYPGLAIWVNVQRRYRQTMDAERIQQLDAIGFVWDVLEAKWYAKFHELQRFQRQHGHCSFPREHHNTEYPGLYVWVENQRSRRHKMDTERIQQLDSIGFVWDARGTSWNVMFEQLRQYQAMYGDCKVPRSYRDPKLSNWVMTQRATSTRTKLSPDQRTKLQSIGFFQ